ncbi:unnamed protein product [Hymenolepis diminuta]|uniref:Peptidase A2 domain-containing protein n=1 Tax=Hymenolepis diminuta TaxID=6216 RepID=A0A564YWU7_HYMDI|nr:unnamed protein product [Hymenolepis diminuta]
MIGSNETRTCQIKKPELDRSPENNPMLQPQTQQTYPNNLTNKPRCRFCGGFHFYMNRPFFKHQCQECNSYARKGDSTRVVYDDRIQTAKEVSIRLNVAEAHGIQTTIQVDVSRHRYEILFINGIFLEFQADTGFDITIVSNEAWKTLSSPKLDTVPFKVYSASGEAIKCKATFKGKTVAIVLYVADPDINRLELV